MFEYGELNKVAKVQFLLFSGTLGRPPHRLEVAFAHAHYTAIVHLMETQNLEHESAFRLVTDSLSQKDWTTVRYIGFDCQSGGAPAGVEEWRAAVKLMEEEIGNGSV